MNERLGIETAINIMGSLNNVSEEQINELRDAYNKYGVEKGFEREFLNDARNELMAINDAFEAAGLGAPFVLSYDQLNESIEKRRVQIRELEEKRSEARRAYTALDVRTLSATNPSLTLAEIEEQKEATRKVWDNYNVLIDNAWREQRALLDQREEIKDPAEFDRNCFSFEYLNSIVNGKAQALVGEDLSATTPLGLEAQPNVSAERLNNMLQARLYGVELSLESAKKRRDLINQSIATFENISNAIGIDLIYEEKEAALNATLGAPTRTLTPQPTPAPRPNPIPVPQPVPVVPQPAPKPNPTGGNDDEDKLNIAVSTASSTMAAATKLIQDNKDKMSQADKADLDRCSNEVLNVILSGDVDKINDKIAQLNDAISRVTNALINNGPSEEDQKRQATTDANTQIVKAINLKQANKTEMSATDKANLDTLIRELTAIMQNGTAAEIKGKTTQLGEAINRITATLNAGAPSEEEEKTKAIASANAEIDKAQTLIQDHAQIDMPAADKDTLDNLIKEVQDVVATGTPDEIKAKTAALNVATSRITATLSSGPSDEDEKRQAIEAASDEIAAVVALMQTKADLQDADKDTLDSLIKEVQDKVVNGTVDEINAKAAELKAAADRIFKDERLTQAREEATDLLGEAARLMLTQGGLMSQAEEETLNRLVDEVRKAKANDQIDEITAKTTELRDALDKIFIEKLVNKATEAANKKIADVQSQMQTQAATLSDENKAALEKVIAELQTEIANKSLEGIKAKTTELDDAADKILTEEPLQKAVEEAENKIAEVESLMQDNEDSLSDEDKETLNDLISELKDLTENAGTLEEIQDVTAQLDEAANRIFKNKNLLLAIKEAEAAIKEADALTSAKEDLAEADKNALEDLINELQTAINLGDIDLIKAKTAELTEATNRIFKDEKLASVVEAAKAAIKETNDLMKAKADLQETDKEMLNNLISELQALIILGDINLIEAKTAELTEATNTIFKDEKLNKAISDASAMIDEVVDALQEWEDDMSEEDKKTIDNLIQEVKDAITSKNIDEIKEKTAKLDAISDIIFDALSALDDAHALYFGSKEDMEEDEKSLLAQKVAELNAARDAQNHEETKKATEELNSAVATIQNNIAQRKQAALDKEVPPKHRFKVIKERAAKVAKFAGRVLMAGAIAFIASTAGIGIATGIWLSPGILAPLIPVLASTGFSAGLQVLYEVMLKVKHGKVPEMEKLGKKNKTPLWLTALPKWAWKKTFGSIKERRAAKKAEREKELEAEQQEQERLNQEHAAMLAASLEAQRNATPGVSPTPVVRDDLGDPFAEDEEDDLKTSTGTPIVGETGTPAEDEDFAKLMNQLQGLYDTSILQDGQGGPIGGPMDFTKFAQILQSGDPDLLARYQALQNNDLGEEETLGGGGRGKF